MRHRRPTVEAPPRVRSLTPQTAKGLGFDLVILINPQAFGDGVEGAADRYVAMTRTTQRLVISTTRLKATGLSPGRPPPTAVLSCRRLHHL